MSLWWVRRDELVPEQIKLIEDLDLHQSFLVTGPPGCGKTNVLLRRAQYVRSQGMSNVMVLTFTRALTEFLKTGCLDANGREIFPPGRVSTIESWLRSLHTEHQLEFPDESMPLNERKRILANNATALRASSRLPVYETMFVDEAQDLLEEEVEAIKAWSKFQFYTGDNNQRIFTEDRGLDPVRNSLPPENERELKFHYRLAKEICQAADRILKVDGGASLASTSYYKGPEPGAITIHSNARTSSQQLKTAKNRILQQARVYEDLIRQGDRIGIVVALRKRREEVFEYFSQDPELQDKVQVVRAREAGESGFDPELDDDRPIYILTVKGCKGLEFRALHWLFSDDLVRQHTREEYYTVVTRAKTSIDIYYTQTLPPILAGAYADTENDLW